MDDARGRGHDAEVSEGTLAPFQELIPFAISFKFPLGIEEEGRGRTEGVHLDRMVDDQVDGHLGVDLGRIAAQAGHGRSH